MEKQEERRLAMMLSSKGIVWADMSDQKKDLAKKVYSLLSPKVEALKELEENIIRQKFNKSSVANELGLNRKTIGHNNREISALIDIFIDQGKKYWCRGKQAHDVSNEEMIKKLMLRDCELIDKDAEIRKLKQKYNEQVRINNAKKEEIERLKLDIETLNLKIIPGINLKSTKGNS